MIIDNGNGKIDLGKACKGYGASDLHKVDSVHTKFRIKHKKRQKYIKKLEANSLFNRNK